MDKYSVQLTKDYSNYKISSECQIKLNVIRKLQRETNYNCGNNICHQKIQYLKNFSVKYIIDHLTKDEQFFCDDYIIEKPQ